MKNFLKIFSFLVLIATYSFADTHEDLILLKKLYQEKNYYKAKELAEKLLEDPSANFYASLVLSDIDFLEGDLYSAKKRIEELIEKFPEKKALLEKRLEKIEKESAFLKEGNKNQYKYFSLNWKTNFKNQKVYDDIENILIEAYQTAGKFFGWYPEDIINVFIYSSKEYETYTTMPHWSQGGYDGKIRLMIYDNISYNQLKELIFHEYAHVAISYITKGNCPTWLNEGLAQYFAFNNTGKTNFKNPKKDFHEIPTNWSSLAEKEVKDLYEESLFLVAKIINKTDEYLIQKVLENLGKNLNIDTALNNALSVYGYNVKTIFED